MSIFSVSGLRSKLSAILLLLLGVVGFAVIPAGAQTLRVREPCNCKACAGASALFDNPLIHGLTIQHLSTQVDSNVLSVVQQIACDAETSAVLLMRWNWDGQPGLSALEKEVFAEHYASNGAMFHVRSGSLAAFFETQWAGAAPRGKAAQQATAQKPHVIRHVFPGSDGVQAPTPLVSSISFLDDAQTCLLLTFRGTFVPPSSHDFALVETLLMARPSASTFGDVVNESASAAKLLAMLEDSETPHTQRSRVRRAGIPLPADR